MDCLANIKFLDALDQPINALAHQLWVGSLLISDHITLDNGESVWIKRPIGTIIDVKIRSLVSAESLYTTNFTEPLSYQDSAFLKLPKFP